MYLIDESYFDLDMVIPNTGGSLDVPVSMKSIDKWIRSRARLCLQNAFGNVLFEDLESNIELSGGNLKQTAPQKWKDLVDGKSYSIGSDAFTWKGLVSGDYQPKESVLAYFVYSQYVEHNRTRLTGLGEAKGKSINSTSIYSRRKWVTYHNKFVESYCGDTCDGYVSLLTYIEHHESDFPNASLKKFEFQNQMGI